MQNGLGSHVGNVPGRMFVTWSYEPVLPTPVYLSALKGALDVIAAGTRLFGASCATAVDAERMVEVPTDVAEEAPERMDVAMDVAAEAAERMVEDEMRHFPRMATSREGDAARPGGSALKGL